MTPTRADLRALSCATIPRHTRVRRLLDLHGLPRGRRARRRFYRLLDDWLAVVVPSNLSVLTIATLPLWLIGGPIVVIESPRWFVRWFLLERPWRCADRWISG